MQDNVDKVKMKNELKFAKHHNLDTQFPMNNETQLPECTHFDKYFKIVMKICKEKHGEVDIGKEE